MAIKVLVVLGTRPDAIKMMPVCAALKSDPAFKTKILVTAQHRQMLDQVLKVFSIHSDYDLDIMEESQTLFHITGETLHKMEKVLRQEKFDIVLVHGDTTTAFAASLSAFYQRIPVGHVEAGLRSFDMENPYPEEANRVLTDAVSTLHFAPTATARNNLISQQCKPDNIFITGNTVIDALKEALKKPDVFTSKKLKHLQEELRDPSIRMILLTAHRRENFGKPLHDICSAIKRIALEFSYVRIVYPVHLNPNVRRPVYRILENIRNVILIKPVDYLTFARCMQLSYCVVTDSGGIQEEAPSLGKPVLVLRKVTERPEAVQAGTVRIAGTAKNTIYQEIKNLLLNRRLYNVMSRAVNPYGDGKASGRIIKAIQYWAGITRIRPKDFKPHK